MTRFNTPIPRPVPKSTVGASDVVSPLVEENHRLEVTRDTKRYTYRALVSGIRGTTQNKLSNAVRAQGIPRIGQAHPELLLHDITVGRLSAMFAGADFPDDVYVEVEYNNDPVGDPFILVPPSEDGPALIEIAGTLQPVRTQFDKNGEQIVVRGFIVDEDAQATREVTQIGEVDVLIPSIVVRAFRREPVSPGNKALTYLGTVNNGQFLGQGEKTWLCTQLSGSSRDGGVTYDVTYEFHRAPFVRNPLGVNDTWESVVTLRDPDTGRPVAFSDGTGALESVDVYPSADFSLLLLPGT